MVAANDTIISGDNFGRRYITTSVTNKNIKIDGRNSSIMNSNVCWYFQSGQHESTYAFDSNNVLYLAPQTPYVLQFPECLYRQYRLYLPCQAYEAL